MWILLLLGIVLLLWYTIHKIYYYWDHENIPYDKPHIPFGCFKSVFTGERSFGMALVDIYNKYRDLPFLGIQLLYRPAIMIRDANLVKDIMTVSFQSFHDRGIYVDEEKDPYSGNLLNLEGVQWKTLRSKLTASFTSGRIKEMFHLSMENASKMVNHINDELSIKSPSVFDMKQLSDSYAIDLIASVIFGLEVNSFKNPKNEFRVNGLAANDKGWSKTLRNMGHFVCPSLENVFRFFNVADPTATFIRKIVNEAVDFREKNNYVRKDLMQMLIQLRNSGTINEGDDKWKIQTVAENLKSMNMEKVAAQGYIFFIAGYETTSGTIAYCLYELVQNPELLQRLIDEIDKVLPKKSDEITYDNLKDMKLLDKCVMETLRKFPGLPLLNRKCTKDYKIPGHDYTIRKGTPIIISLLGMQRDEEYFPDPLKFDPDRFDKDAPRYNPAAFMPFGEGPRNCIAYRMGLINAKIAIVSILRNFTIECVEKKEIEIANYSVVIVPNGPLSIKFTKRST